MKKSAARLEGRSAVGSVSRGLLAKRAATLGGPVASQSTAPAVERPVITATTPVSAPAPGSGPASATTVSKPATRLHDLKALHKANESVAGVKVDSASPVSVLVPAKLEAEARS